MREIIEITGGDSGRPLGFRLELEGWRKTLIKSMPFADEEIECHCEGFGRKSRPWEVR